MSCSCGPASRHTCTVTSAMIPSCHRATMSHPCDTSGHVSTVTAGVTSPCNTIKSTAYEEKHEMESLNDRLAAYVSRVRNLRNSAHEFDVSGYRDAIRSLEEEIVKVKGLYETELGRLRCRLDSATSEKSTYGARLDSTDALIGDLRARLCEQKEKSEKLSLELSLCRKELEMKKPNHLHFDTQITEARTRLDAEITGRLEAEEYTKTLREKLEFEVQIRHRERCELHERLKTSAEIIRSLETKLREVTSVPNVDMTDILKKLRESTMVDLHRYKAETEQALNKNLSALKHQIDSEKSVRSGLQLEKSRMEELIVELRTRLAEADGQMTALIQQKKAMEETLRSERYRASTQIRELEVKLSEMNDVMLNKVRECTDAREAQVSLKAEIDTFKAIMDEGETRISVGNHTTSPISYDKMMTTGAKYTKASEDFDFRLSHTPKPPSSLLRRPTSAHSSCLYTQTRPSPCDDPIFHSEVRIASGLGGSYTGNKMHHGCSTDDMLLSSHYGTGRKVTVECHPTETIRKINVSGCLEVSGKGLNGCCSPSFPKRSQCWGERYRSKKGECRPKSERPHTAYHVSCHNLS